MQLWTINKWLRWTGFRLVLEVDVDGLYQVIEGRQAGDVFQADIKPTQIYFKWYGYKWLFTNGSAKSATKPAEGSSQLDLNLNDARRVGPPRNSSLT